MTPDDDETSIRLNVLLERGPTPGVLEIRTYPEEATDYFFPADIALILPGQTLGCRSKFYGYSFYKFCDELINLRQTLCGSAKLFDWDYDELLCFSALNQRGTVIVGGRFDILAFGEPVCESRFLKAVRPNPRDDFDYVGTCSMFDGFLLDQSDLQRAISFIRRFIQENNINIKNPDA